MDQTKRTVLSNCTLQIHREGRYKVMTLVQPNVLVNIAMTNLTTEQIAA